jgi:peptidoglycan hydrolase CwlO-like protein
MTSLLDSAYTQINDLISINSDDIQTESISTNTLILNGSDINTSLTNLNNLLSVFNLAGMYYDGTLNAFFISLCDLRLLKTLYLYDASNNPFSVNTFIINTNGYITSINSSITNINGSITSINNSITSINGSITSINGSISTINQKLTVCYL